MPEMKNQFTGGKMNKDVDERLVPKGEYRDAMNIQVATSEGSEVGTVQNILGNSEIQLPFSTMGFSCVGSITDEKTDSSYWFLRGPDMTQYPANIGIYGRNYIIRLKGGVVSIVFTDTKDIYTKAQNYNPGQGNPILPVINFDEKSIRLPIGNLVNTVIGDTLESIVDLSTGISYPQDLTVVQINAGNPPWIVVNNEINVPNSLGSSVGGFGLVFRSNCLNFQENTLITGISILDDLLMWTDNHNEPKLLSIERSILGTNQNGITHTVLLNPELPTLLGHKVRSHHIQMLKRKPTHYLKATVNDSRRNGIIYSTTSFKFSSVNGVILSPGFNSTLTVFSGLAGTNVNYQVGDTILLLNTPDVIANNGVNLPDQRDVKLIVKAVSHDQTTGTSIIDFEIISLSSSIPLILQDYTVLLDEKKSDDFENLILRFSYRYRFLNKQVSSFAPFTQPIFIPGEFKYNQKNAYNEGMVNNAIEITLSDFIDFPNTLDVSDIELLVKHENSPNVYLIDTVPRGLFPDLTPNIWGDPFGGTYNFSPNQIKATLSGNQLLRAWDNVPKKALAQEVTGNRVIYGNYTESYDYKTSDLSLFPSITARPLELIREKDGAPSVKSGRNYQLGVVLVDAEGRESPIITNNTSNVTVDKSYVDTNVMLNVKNNSSFPEWVNRYRYYVKDSSIATYNIVTDAFYKADNGDYWLSVPSSERNKVKIGDILDLKKGINGDSAVLRKSTTKIIAIENEAPDFIKEVYKSLGKAKYINNQSSTPQYLFDVNGLPALNKEWFWISESAWVGQNDEAFGGGGELAGLKNAFIQFEASPSITTAVGGIYKSKIYSCTSISKANIGSSTTQVLVVRLDEFIRAGDSWIIDPLSTSGTALEPTLSLHVFEKRVSASSEYAGKFFIKVESKEDLLDDIANDAVNKSWEEIIFQQSIHNLCDLSIDRNTDVSMSGLALNEITFDSEAYNSYPPTFANPAYWVDHNVLGRTDNLFHWDALLEYSSVMIGNSVPQYWFLDRMWYDALQVNSNSTFPDDYQDGNNFGRGIFQAGPADVSNTNLYGGYFVQDGKYYMELSCVGMFATIDANSIGNVANQTHGWDVRWLGFPNPSSLPYDWGSIDIHNASTPSNHQDFMHYIRLPGQKFKWDGSDKVFEIKNTKVLFRYNYAGDRQAALQEGYDEISASQASPPTQYYEYARRVFSHPLNRRLTIVVELDEDPRDFGINPLDSNVYGTSLGNDAVPFNMVFIEGGYKVDKDLAIRTSNPAVFEVKTSDNEALDIYYEASSEIPIDLSFPSLSRLIPKGSKVSYPGDAGLLTNSVVDLISNSTPTRIKITGNIVSAQSAATWNDIVTNNKSLTFTTPQGDIISMGIQAVTTNSTSPYITPVRSTLNSGFTVGLPWYNCISFRNGVESFFIKDDFNEKFITKGVKVSSTLEEDYKEIYKKSGLIYSGLYNHNSDTNNLNQFIQAEKITKDLNPTYGSIQKLYAGWGQGGDLIALCEDRILRILADKDALYNADGNMQLTSTNNVLGIAIPYAGEYGISKNPESFASEAFRCYFTDKVRGAVMRLSTDGLTPISDHGMKDWFRDHLQLGQTLIGSYDDKKSEYNITLKGTNIATTVSFREDVKGWVSFKSFVPENAISCANEYYTFLNGKLYQHHSTTVNRNTFYGLPLVNSTLEAIFNEVPGSVKSFKTINYEGSRARITQFLGADGEYFNLAGSTGWYVDDVATNLEQSGITEFIEKEGKWFGYITGDDVIVNPANGLTTGNYDTEDSSIQGIGILGYTNILNLFGCTDETMFNYEPAATNTCQVSTNCCIPFIYGCVDVSADNYIATTGNPQIDVNTDDNSCLWYGCMTPLATLANESTWTSGASGSINFDPQANFDDGTCTTAIYGCTDVSAFNFDVDANIASGILSDGTSCGYGNCMCIPIITGCTDPSASNYIVPSNPMTDVNTSSNTCVFNGCTNSIASNYSFPLSSPAITATGQTLIVNSVTLGTVFDDGSCIINYGCMDVLACNYDPIAFIEIPGSCQYCGDNNAENYDNGTCNDACIYCNPPSNLTLVSQTTSDTINGVDQNNGTVTLSLNETTIVTGASISIPNTFVEAYMISNSVGNINEIIDASGGSPNMYGSSIVSSGWGSGVITFTLTGLPLGASIITASSFCGGQTSNNYWALFTMEYVNPTATVVIGSPLIYGCMDNTGSGNNIVNPNGWGACNYNPLATIDDGSCVYGICAGCNYPAYIEYCDDCWDSANQAQVASGGSPWVGWLPGSCTTLIIPGCIDPTMFNYNALANVDNGSCIPFVYGCMDNTTNNYLWFMGGTPSYATNFNAAANTPCNASSTGSGNNECCNPYNCAIPSLQYNYNSGIVQGYWSSNGIPWQSPQTSGPSGAKTLQHYTPTLVVTNSLGIISTTHLLGWSESNYSTNVSIPQAQLNTWGAGQTSIQLELTLSRVAGAHPDNGCSNSDTLILDVGCKNALATNYNPNAHIADNSQCTYPPGCMDATLNNNGSGFAASNYNAIYQSPCGGDNSCCAYATSPMLVAIAGGVSGNGTVQNIRLQTSSTANTPLTSVGSHFSGQITSSAGYYFINTAGSQTSLQTYPLVALQNPISTNIAYDIPNTDWVPHVKGAYPNQEVEIVVRGRFQGAVNNTYISNLLYAFSPWQTQTFTAGCKVNDLASGTTALNLQPNVNLHIPSSCIALVLGCMDPTALNYDAAANTDDGSCTYH